MRKRRLAASTAMLISVGSLMPTVAQAATTAATTLYVDNVSGSNCSNSGSGTSAVPFCTIQAAVNAAVPGQTVLVAPGYYPEAVTITKSGTSTAPITITGTVVQGARADVAPGSATAPAFTVSGASYVTVSALMAGGASGTVALVEGSSSHVTIDSMQHGILNGTSTDPLIHVTGAASYVTISRNDLIQTGHTSAVRVDAGGSHDFITTNGISGFGVGIAVNGATGTAITGNTVASSCDQGIALTGASTGSTIENNVVGLVQGPANNSACPATTALVTGIEVDSAAVSGTKLDYNINYQLYAAVSSYVWSGTRYEDPTTLNSATGQGAHDLFSDPRIGGFNSAYSPSGDSSPAVDSADSSAPGELTTDMYGNAREDDPNVTNTGAGVHSYYDRGAGELQDPLAVAVSLDSGLGTAPATFTATESIATAGWSPVTTWTINFGDGSATITTSAPTTVQHTYTQTSHPVVTVTGTDSYGTASATFTIWILSSSAFHPMSATRLLDTRNGTGTGGVIAPVRAGSALALQIEGNGPIQATGVTAVALNVTETNAKSPGFLTAYADGTSRPNTSNLNFAAGQTVAGQVIAPVGGDGRIDLYNAGTGTVDLVADVAGYYGAGIGTGLITEGAPVRILDSRNGTGTGGVIAPVPARGTLKLTSDQLSAGEPAVLNVTVTNAKSPGFLTAYADGTSRPNTSNLNFTAGQTVANQVIVPVGSDGSIDLYNSGTGTVDVIADALGIFQSSSGAGYNPIVPTRLLDTRYGIGGPAAKVPPLGIVQVTMAGVAGLPSNVQTVAANVTVTDPTGYGDIEAYPDNLLSPPGPSTVNFTPGLTVANETTLSAQPTGIKLFNQSPGSSDLVVDVFGYYQ